MCMVTVAVVERQAGEQVIDRRCDDANAAHRPIADFSREREPTAGSIGMLAAERTESESQRERRKADVI